MPTNHERDGSSPSEPERLDIPDLPEQPVEPSTIIREAFAEAEDSGGELPEWGARAIAQSLVDQQDEPTPALRDFAESGEGDLEAISREAMPIYNQAGCSPWVKRQIDYLLTFLLDRGRPAATAAPKDTGTSEIAEEHLSVQAAEGIYQHGDAFRAFLELKDVDEDDPNLLDNFREFYIGRFTTFDQLMSSLTDLDMWTREINAVAEELGIPGYVMLDMAALETHTLETWDIVTYNGAFYVFDK